MNKSNFTVIRGGLLDSVKTSRRQFVSAYITNTRLMGVVGMYIHFELPDNEVMQEIHQFFYFDIEEYGFETYESVKGSDPNKLTEIENNLIGGLGGEKEPITLREAQYVLQHYARYNKNHNLPLPEGKEEYGFLLEQDILLSPGELKALIKKECVEIDSNYEVVNYFIMRCIGRDFLGASYLAAKEFPLDLFPEFTAGTFCKNLIDKGKTPNTYISESLIEIENEYHLVITAITVEQMLVTSYERISAFKISPSEAAMMLARPEFISVYALPEDGETFNRLSTKLTPKAMVTEHDSGDLYMIFHPNNKHVAKKEYRLSEDVLGIYFVTKSNQLITVSYTMSEIRFLEYDLASSEIGHRCHLLSRYEFIEPVLFEFIQSGFVDFEKFVDAIRIE